MKRSVSEKGRKVIEGAVEVIRSIGSLAEVVRVGAKMMLQSALEEEVTAYLQRDYYERVMARVSRFLEKRLKVTVNRDKSKVVKAEESCFLGFTFTRKRLTVSEKSFTRLKSALRRLTGRSWGISMARGTAKFVRISRGG